MSQRPILRGLKLCQQVIVEEGTRNYTLVNCFSELEVEYFPSDPRQFTVHAILSDAKGDMDMTVAIYRLDDLLEVYRRGNRLSFADRLLDYRFSQRVRDFVAPTLGKYEACLLADEEPIGHATFTVKSKRS